MPGMYIVFDRVQGIAKLFARANKKLVSPTLIVTTKEAVADSFDFAGLRFKEKDVALFKPAQALWIRKQIRKQLNPRVDFYPLVDKLSISFPSPGGDGHKMRVTISKQSDVTYYNISIDGVAEMRYHPNFSDTEFQKQIDKVANRIFVQTAFYLSDEKLDLIRSVVKQFASQSVLKKVMLKL